MSDKFLYSLLRPALFSMDAERAHHFTLHNLKRLGKLGLLRAVVRPPAPDPRTVMGLTFRNPVGLAAGLDKDGAYIDALADLGFGSIEVGTVTPRAQPGNPLPRMFRLPAAHGIINRVPASSRSWLYSGRSPSSTNSHCSDGGSTAAMAWAYLRVSDSLRRLPTRTAIFLVM